MCSLNRIVLVFLAFSIALLLSACSDDNYEAKNVSTDDIQKILDSKQDGFVIIKNEEDAQFLREVHKALLEKKQTALQFDVFRNDGENENVDGLSKNPFRYEMLHVNSLYYIEKGVVVDEFQLEIHEGIKQYEELKHFIEAMIER